MSPGGRATLDGPGVATLYPSWVARQRWTGQRWAALGVLPSAMAFRRQLMLATKGRGSYEITALVAEAISASGVGDGLASVFIHHTSASLFIGENADPDVLRDLEAFMARLVPDGDPLYRHIEEGDDDMPAHVRAVLTASSLAIPIAGGRLDLGTWQGIFVWEHRRVSHQRRLTVTAL
jgi:secondary thiamine-phosphate synthase enzyme